jgi:hypothetical protein
MEDEELHLALRLSSELAEFTEQLQLKQALSNSLKTKHYYQSSRQERTLLCEDVVCESILPILIAWGSWRIVVSLFNVNTKLYRYFSQRIDKIKEQMFAYRQVDAQLLMHHYVSNDKFLIRNELSLDRFVVCAFCDEERSVTKDMRLFIKEWGQSAVPGRYYYQSKRDSEFENGFMYILQAKSCLDYISLTQ